MWNRCFAYKDTTRSKFEKAKSDLYLIDFKGDFVVELFVFGAIIGYGVVDDKCFAPCVCVIYFAVVQGAPVVKMTDPAGTGQATNPGRAKAIPQIQDGFSISHVISLPSTFAEQHFSFLTDRSLCLLPGRIYPHPWSGSPPRRNGREPWPGFWSAPTPPNPVAGSTNRWSTDTVR